MLTLSAEDPTILSGTVRSTLDVFDEYSDAEIVSRFEGPLFEFTHKASIV